MQGSAAGPCSLRGACAAKISRLAPVPARSLSSWTLPALFPPRCGARPRWRCAYGNCSLVAASFSPSGRRARLGERAALRRAGLPDRHVRVVELLSSVPTCAGGCFGDLSGSPGPAFGACALWLACCRGPGQYPSPAGSLTCARGPALHWTLASGGRVPAGPAVSPEGREVLARLCYAEALLAARGTCRSGQTSPRCTAAAPAPPCTPGLPVPALLTCGGKCAGGTWSTPGGTNRHRLRGSSAAAPPGLHSSVVPRGRPGHIPGRRFPPGRGQPRTPFSAF